MREIRIEARVRNNILYHVIFDKFKSAAAFCRMYKLNQAVISDMLNLKYRPLRKNGVYTKTCEKVAKISKLPPDIIFSPILYEIKQPKKTWEIYFSQLPSIAELKQLPAASNPENDMLNAEFKEAVYKALSSLTTKEGLVLRQLYGFEGDGEKTLDQVGTFLHLSKTRIAQIRDKALRKLRYHGRVGLSEHKFIDKI